MIVFVVGTSGSGKTTLAKMFLEAWIHNAPANTIEDRFAQGRKQPMSLELRSPRRIVVVPGHYNAACGGADTIHSFDELYGVIKEATDTVLADVFVEGLLLISSWSRMVELHKAGHDVRVIGLSKVPLDVCEDGVVARREAKAEKTGTPVKEFGPNFKKNIAAKWRDVDRTLDKLAAEGVHVYRCDREEAYRLVCSLFGVRT